jgi:Icc-related predicted phosphoesterase
VDIETRAKRSQSLLQNDWFRETIEDLREHQKSVFASSGKDDVSDREEAHAILRALNAIEHLLQADVDAVKLLNKKGKHRGHD